MTLELGVEVRALTAKEVLSHRAEVSEIWPDASRARIDEILPRHVAREGFRFFGGFVDDRLVGFVYGYFGAPGQWWHDRVAAALGPEATEQWLGPGHFEFTELHVRPDFRRRGIGGRLHDTVLDGIDSPTAVLSTQIDNDPAIALYRERGWRVIVPFLDFGSGRPFLIMGKELG